MNPVFIDAAGNKFRQRTCKFCGKIWYEQVGKKYPTVQYCSRKCWDAASAKKLEDMLSGEYYKKKKKEKKEPELTPEQQAELEEKRKRADEEFKASEKVRLDLDNRPFMKLPTLKSSKKHKEAKEKREQKQLNKMDEEALRVYLRDQIEQLKSYLILSGNAPFDSVIDYRSIGDISESTRQEVLERDKYECQICRKKTNLHIHHKIPRKNGGDHSADNLITLCSSCHRAVESSDIDTAVNICYKNASKTWYNVDDAKETLLAYLPDLEEIYEELNKSPEENYDVLVKLSRVLDNFERFA